MIEASEERCRDGHFSLCGTGTETGERTRHVFHSIPFGGHRSVRHYPRLVVGVRASARLLVLPPFPGSTTCALGRGDPPPPLGNVFPGVAWGALRTAPECFGISGTGPGFGPQGFLGILWERRVDR